MAGTDNKFDVPILGVARHVPWAIIICTIVRLHYYNFLGQVVPSSGLLLSRRNLI